MRFGFTGDQRELAGAVREILASELTAEVRASGAEAAGRRGRVWKALSEAGVFGLLVREEAGGLGLNELELSEQKGQVVGKRTGQGVSYDLAGSAFYAAKQGATIRLHGTATISGKTYNYDYFGYVMPAWTGIGTTPDTIIGTVLRSDPANPNNAPLIANFSATREPAK